MDAERKWVLEVDVKTTLAHLTKIISDCLAAINETIPQQHYLAYLDVIKISATLEGFKIVSADINIKLPKHPAQTIKTCIKDCWRLHQIQDAKNHLGNANDFLKFDSIDLDEVLHVLDNVTNSLQKSRSSLSIPKKRTIEELQHSQNMQSIRPALPLDLSISFYVQSQNLVCSVYQLIGPQIRAEYQAELELPFLSKIFELLSLALQTCQQLKDKLEIFTYD